MSQVFYYPDLISTPWLCMVVAANQFISSLVNCEIKLVYIYLVDPIVWLRQTTLLFAGLWQCVWLARIWCGWRTSRPIKVSPQEAWIPPFLYLFKRMTSTSTVYKISWHLLLQSDSSQTSQLLLYSDGCHYHQQNTCTVYPVYLRDIKFAKMHL